MNRYTPASEDLGDLSLVMVVFCLILVIGGAILERLERRRRDRELLPPPADGRAHNEDSIAEYRRKRAAIDRNS